MTVPNSSTVMRSAWFMTNSRSCSTTRIASPSARSCVNSRARPCFSRWRRPAAGSSSSSTAGWPASARAISTMRCCPSGSDPAGVWATAARPQRSIWRMASPSTAASSARSARSMEASQPLWPRRCAPRATLSSTLRSPSRRTCWKVRPRPSAANARDGLPCIGWPINTTCPSVGSSTPEIMLKKVLLPAPLGPISACTSPARTSM